MAALVAACRLAALLALAGVLAAGEPAALAVTWDYLPAITYDDEELTLILRPGASAWKPVDDAGVAVPTTAAGANGEAVKFTFTPTGRHSLAFVNRDGARQVLRLLRPGEARGLALDAQRRLTQDGNLVILALARVEAHADRRWAILRSFSEQEPKPCALRLSPPAVPWGEAELTAQLCASQAIDPTGKGVLVELGGGDRLAAWKHREYRQMLAWLIADAFARGADNLVIVQPLAPTAEEAAIVPLWLQVRDVAAAYHTQLIGVEALAAHGYWTIAGGVLGTELNASGQAALAALLKPWLLGGK